MFFKFFLTFITILISSNAIAMFSVQPHKLLFDSGQETLKVKIVNTAKNKKIYHPSFLNYTQKKDGNYEVKKNTKNKSYSAEYLKIEPKEISLDSGESDYFEISFKKNVTKTGEFLSYFAILEKEHPDEKEKGMSIGGMVIKGEFRVAIPVIIRNGTLIVEANIKSAKLTENKKKQAVLNVFITRKGNKSLRGNIKVFDGKNKIGELNAFPIYTHVSGRKISVSLTKKVKDKLIPLSKSELKNKQIIVEYIANEEDSIPLEIIKTFKL